MREFWEAEMKKALDAAAEGGVPVGGAGAGAPRPGAAEHAAAFDAWMAACRLLEVEASELEVRRAAFFLGGEGGRPERVENSLPRTKRNCRPAM